MEKYGELFVHRTFFLSKHGITGSGKAVSGSTGDNEEGHHAVPLVMRNELIDIQVLSVE